MPVFTFTILYVLWEGSIVDVVLKSVVGMMKVRSPRGALKYFSRGLLPFRAW